MSVRVRVTIWNVFFLACILTGMGLALRWTLQVSLMSAINREVMSLARHEQELASHPPSSIPPFPPPAVAMRPDKDSPFSRFTMESLDTSGHAIRPPNGDAPYRPDLFRRALLGDDSIVTTTVNGVRLRLLYVPLRHDGHIVGAAQVSGSLEDMVQELRKLTSVLLLLIGPGLLIAGLGGAFLTKRALLPVRRITEAAERIEAEDLSGRLSVSGHDELSELSLTFNGMLARLEESFREREAAYARLELVNKHLELVNERQRQFTADASHELKTPLTVIQGTVSLALSGRRTVEQYKQDLTAIGGASSSMTKIVHDLLLLARSDAGLLKLDKHAAPLRDIIDIAKKSAAGANPDANIAIDIDRDVNVTGDTEQLSRLFTNLLDNSLRHTPAGGSIEVSAKQAIDGVTITVSDTGSGIAAEHIPHIFERFYRADSSRTKSRGGTGLGLAISKSIVDAHGGSISISSEIGKGTRVEISLPSTEESAPNAESSAGRADSNATRR